VAEPSSVWWSTPSDERRKYRRAFDAIPANRAKKKARQKAYYYRHRERRLAEMRMINYKCSPADYQSMLIAQGGTCAICKSPEATKQKGRLRRLSVDHDHLTGRIRALLCGACNTGLGSLQHDPALLAAAVAYLDAHASDR